MLGPADPLNEQPLQRRCPGRGSEASYQRPHTDVGLSGEVGERERFVEPRDRPVEQWREGVAVARGQGGVDVLCLTAIAMWWDDHATGEGVGDVGAEVESNQ